MPSPCSDLLFHVQPDSHFKCYRDNIKTAKCLKMSWCTGTDHGKIMKIQQYDKWRSMCATQPRNTFKIWSMPEQKNTYLFCYLLQNINYFRKVRSGCWVLLPACLKQLGKFGRSVLGYSWSQTLEEVRNLIPYQFCTSLLWVSTCKWRASDAQSTIIVVWPDK